MDDTAKIQQFVNDMAEALGEMTATERQREVAKATLRYAVNYANRRAVQRKGL